MTPCPIELLRRYLVDGVRKRKRTLAKVAYVFLRIEQGAPGIKAQNISSLIPLFPSCPWRLVSELRLVSRQSQVVCE
jgi:hypothetical protein